MPKKTTKKNRAALVTGGAGFIGSNLADRLVREGWRVAVVDDLSNGRRQFAPKEAVFHRLDVRDPKLTEVFGAERPEAVFHLAAQIDVRVSVAHPVRDAETNIHGSLNVLQECVKNGVKKIIFSSSGGAIYHGLGIRPAPENVPAFPLTPYGVAKLAFEMYLHAACHQHGLEWVALRYANVYGPRQGAAGEGGVIGLFAGRMLKGEPVAIFGDGEQTRDFVYVGDVVDANLSALAPGVKGVYNIGTGKETTVNRAAELLKTATGYSGRIGRGPAVKGEERFSSLDSSSAKAAFGWRAKVDIEEGIKKTVEWFKNCR